jgi:two-component SAPR family response regulator
VTSGRGISNERLIDILWPDKSEDSAKNNRAANLSRLKSILTQMGSVELSRSTGQWKIHVDTSLVYFDYYHYLQIINDRKHITKEKIDQLIEITQRGNFLANFYYPWLDQIKSEITNQNVDIFLEYANTLKCEEHPEFLIKLADSLFHLDPVNEEAMIIKCKCLAHLGKHSLSKQTFENFIKEFKALYGEEFKRDFHSVLGGV